MVMMTMYVDLLIFERQNREKEVKINKKKIVFHFCVEMLPTRLDENFTT
jgi:hypothetical protein